MSEAKEIKATDKTKLIHSKFGKEIRIGDKLKSFRDDEAQVTGFDPPHKEGSSGRVYVKWLTGPDTGETGKYYAGVFGCEYVKP